MSESTGTDHLRQAHEELRNAANRVADHLVGADVRNHLRAAARHMLQAGVAALDEADRRAKPAAPSAPVTVPVTAG